MKNLNQSIDKLKEKMEKLYIEKGLTNEVVKLSQQLDELILKKQKEINL